MRRLFKPDEWTPLFACMSTVAGRSGPAAQRPRRVVGTNLTARRSLPVCLQLRTFSSRVGSSQECQYRKWPKLKTDGTYSPINCNDISTDLLRHHSPRGSSKGSFDFWLKTRREKRNSAANTLFVIRRNAPETEQCYRRQIGAASEQAHTFCK